MQRKKLTSVGIDLKSPLEKVLEIMNNLRDKIDTQEDQMIKELNYCIKIISSNKLYEAELEFEGSPDGRKKNDVISWYNQFSSKKDTTSNL